MNMQDNLRALAQSDIPAAPFGFDEFRTAARPGAAARRRTACLSTAGSIAALACRVHHGAGHAGAAAFAARGDAGRAGRARA